MSAARILTQPPRFDKMRPAANARRNERQDGVKLMKILVMSDAHGDAAAMTKVLDRCDGHVDMCVFLGDGVDAAEYSLSLFPLLARVIVCGNCDSARLTPSSAFPDEALFEADGVNFLCMHGHRHGVKGGISRAAEYAAKKGAQVLLYGHTHRKCDETVDTPLGAVRAINPGSIGRGGERTFALVETVGGKIVCGFGDL